MWFLKFLRSNLLYIMWFLFYFIIAWFIFGATAKSFLVVSIIYGISMTVALSPVGEALLRFIENCRIPRTQQEKEYLFPLFDEVYQDAKKENPSLNSGIKIYIMDAMYVNAFAIGRKTVAVTRGAMETFNKEELKGILAHELGHMTHGHTKALLLTYIGNLLFTLIVFTLRIMLKIMEFIANIAGAFHVIGLFFRFLLFVVRVIFEVCIFLFVNAGEFILAINSQVNEMEADKFAHTIGFGRELIDALYLLQKISMNTKLKLSEKLKASHPHTADRIGNLERLESLANEV